jgi:DnaJ-class molecular chaperone
MGKPNVRPCQNCHGQGTIQVETKPGKWERRTCGACGGSGKIIISNI